MKNVSTTIPILKKEGENIAVTLAGATLLEGLKEGTLSLRKEKWREILIDGGSGYALELAVRGGIWVITKKPELVFKAAGYGVLVALSPLIATGIAISKAVDYITGSDSEDSYDPKYYPHYGDRDIFG